MVLNAEDRFGGTALDDATRHNNRGAAALLEQAGCLGAGHPHLQVVTTQIKAEAIIAKNKACQPNILHMLQNSQESSALRIVSADLTMQIQEQHAILEPILKRLAWALKGLCVSFFRVKTIATSSTPRQGFIIPTWDQVCVGSMYSQPCAYEQVRMRMNGGRIPQQDPRFVLAAQHLQQLVADMRVAVLDSRTTLHRDMVRPRVL